MSGKAAVALMLLGSVLAASAAQALDTGELTIQTRQGPLTYFVEVARTPSERSQGLMFRKQLPKDHGMLFVFERTQSVSFWMDNTPIPLDLLFADAEGEVVNLHANAVPFSQDLIPSRQPIRYVLEIPGGVAKQRGIRVGDRLRSALIK